MSFRARDFFEAWAPLALPGRAPADAPDVLLLRSVLHDWKDEDCKRYVRWCLIADWDIGILTLPHTGY